MGLELKKQSIWSTLKDLGAAKNKVSINVVYDNLTLPTSEIDVLLHDLQDEGEIFKPTESTVKLFY